jgi:uncharacterized protein
MFLEGDFFAQSCANEFAFNMGIMMAAIWHLTGMVVVGVGSEATPQVGTSIAKLSLGAA